MQLRLSPQKPGLRAFSAVLMMIAVSVTACGSDSGSSELPVEVCPAIAEWAIQADPVDSVSAVSISTATGEITSTSSSYRETMVKFGQDARARSEPANRLFGGFAHPDFYEVTIKAPGYRDFVAKNVQGASCPSGFGIVRAAMVPTLESD